MHDLRLHGLVYYALKRGGSIHPIILPKELTGETGIMNPSIFNRDGRLFMNIRHVNYTLHHSENHKFPHCYGPLQYIHPENDISLTTHNIVCELDGDMNLLTAGQVKMNFNTKPTWNFIGLEDARLFVWEDRMFLCGVRRDAYDDKGTGRMELCEIDFVDGIWQEIGRYPIPAPPPNKSYCEKNWMPVLDKPWHFVKWTNPTEVVKFNIEDGTTEQIIHDPTKTYPTLWRDVRGGTQVVQIAPDRRMAITHEVDLMKDIHGRKDGHYAHRAIMWDDDWNIIHHTKEFTFMGSQTDWRVGSQHVIEFATGLAFAGADALISYGFQDNGIFILKMPQEVFFDFLLRG